MKQQALVRNLLPGGRAELSVRRESACGNKCEDCAGCAPAQEVLMVADNPAGAAVGDVVWVEADSAGVLGRAALVYAFPFALFFLCYFLARPFWSESGAAAAAAAGFAVSLLLIRLIDRRLSKCRPLKLTIVSVERS